MKSLCLLLSALALMLVAFTGSVSASQKEGQQYAAELFEDCAGNGLQFSPATEADSSTITLLPSLPIFPVIPNIRMQQIGSDPQMAVVYECWYALRQSYLRTPNSTGPTDVRSDIGGYVVSNWNYLANDWNAVKYVQSIYGGTVPGRTNVSVSSYFASTNNYALRSGIGRGAQCVSFATMILYRALGGYRGLVWNWASINPASYVSARNAHPGDLVFYKTSNGNHVAVCVRNLGSGGIDVVDSNWVGYGSNAWSVGIYGGRANSEIIGRHTVAASVIDSGGWKTYSGNGKWYRRKD